MTNDLGWMLKDLMATVAGATDAAVFSDDGMLTAHSDGLDRDEAEPLAAGCTSLWSLAKNTSKGTLGTPRMLMVECSAGYLFVRSAAPGAALAVRAAATVDAGVLYQQADLLVTRMREHLAAPPRTEDGPSA